MNDTANIKDPVNIHTFKDQKSDVKFEDDDLPLSYSEVTGGEIVKKGWLLKSPPLNKPGINVSRFFKLIVKYEIRFLFQYHIQLRNINTKVNNNFVQNWRKFNTVTI